MRRIPFLLFALLLPNAAQAQVSCGETGAGCIPADNQPPNPFARALRTLPTEAVSQRGSVSLQLGYLRTPLKLTASSPDPFGRRVSLLEHWWVGYAQATTGVGRHWRFGAQVPVSLAPSAPGLASLDPSPHTLFLGDPRVSVMFQARKVVQWFTTYELSLPVGSPKSFVHSDSPTLKTSAGIATRFADLQLAANLGATFRETISYRGSRFGSSVQAGIGTAYQWRGMTVGLELNLSPSLVRDRSPADRRRVPADWLVTVGQTLGTYRVFAGTGSSLPLSRARGKWTSGPPGAAYRILVGAEWVNAGR